LEKNPYTRKHTYTHKHTGIHIHTYTLSHSLSRSFASSFISNRFLSHTSTHTHTIPDSRDFDLEIIFSRSLPNMRTHLFYFLRWFSAYSLALSPCRYAERAYCLFATALVLFAPSFSFTLDVALGLVLVLAVALAFALHLTLVLAARFCSYVHEVCAQALSLLLSILRLLFMISCTRNAVV